MIVITSPHKEFSVMAYEAFRKHSIEPFIIESILEDAVEKVKKLVKYENIEVILSRGGTAALLKSIEIPLITADVTDLDILKAIESAKSMGKPIGFLGYEEDSIIYDFDSISRIMSLDINLFAYASIDEIKTSISKAISRGIKILVVGSQFAADVCKENNMPCILVKTSNRTMDLAVNKIFEVINTIKYNNANVSILNTILNIYEEGVIATDSQDTIILANKKSCQLLNCERKDIIGRDINKLNLIINYFTNVKSGKHHKEVVRNAVIGNLVINYYPIIVKNDFTGSLYVYSKIERIQQIEKQIRQKTFDKGFIATKTFENIHGNSELIRKTIDIAKVYATTDHTILIFGETGTGKEIFAQGIHNASNRGQGPFVAVNCGALSESLLESELFGYVEGSFTGAKKGGKTGLFEQAHNGTIFLDEISKMSLALQGKLLRVLQERKIRPVGADRVLPIDVRIITATNQNLNMEMDKGRFLPDLFHRINVLNLSLPTLRQRREDIPVLVNHFVTKNSNEDSNIIDVICNLINSKLFAYQWPGNVRELENLILRMIVLRERIEDNVFTNDYLPILMDGSNFTKDNNDGGVLAKEAKFPFLNTTLKEIEREIIMKVLIYYNRNKSLAARELGISRNTINAKLK